MGLLYRLFPAKRNPTAHCLTSILDSKTQTDLHQLESTRRERSIYPFILDKKKLPIAISIIKGQIPMPAFTVNKTQAITLH